MKTIILEGPDGAGKTTLADALIKLGYDCASFGVPPTGLTEEQHLRRYLEPLLNIDHAMVFDRFHLGERVYGDVMRGGSTFTERGEHLLERYLEAIDGQVVICLPSHRVALANWLARKGSEYVQHVTKFNAVYRRYVKLLFNPRRNQSFLWYDYTRRTVASFARALHHSEGRPLVGAVGSQRPRFLFVGEQAVGLDDLPFMSTENSSGYFYNALRSAGYLEPELAFTSAFWIDGRPRDLVTVQCQFTTVPAIITVGDYAQKSADQQGLPVFGHIVHPQYAKLFQARRRSAYIQQLAALRRRAR